MPGWNILNSFHDPMHVILLGTCRDLYASSLGFWIRRNFFGEGSTLEGKLLQFSLELKEACKREKNLNLRYNTNFAYVSFSSRGVDKLFFCERSLALKDQNWIQAVHASEHWAQHCQCVSRNGKHFQSCIPQECNVVFCKKIL